MKKMHKLFACIAAVGLMFTSCGDRRGKDLVNFKDHLLNEINDTTYFLDYHYSKNASYIDSIVRDNPDYNDNEAFLNKFDSSKAVKELVSQVIEPNIIENLLSHTWWRSAAQNNGYWERALFYFEKDGTVEIKLQRLRDLFNGGWRTEETVVSKWNLQYDEKKFSIKVGDNSEFFITPDKDYTDFTLRGPFTLKKAES